MKLKIKLASLILLFPFITNADSWTQIANFGGGTRTISVAFSIGAYGYVGTGVWASGNYSTDFWKFDPALNTWTSVAALPAAARKGATGFSIAGKGYICTGESNTGTLLNDLWEYDPLLNS